MRPRGGSGGASVRILGGRWKGRRLDGPAAARPTSGRARQALFNLLSGRVVGARVLDLYAGTGAVGLEAVSRGAASAVLVEADGRRLAGALERLGADPEEVRLIVGAASDAVDDLARRAEHFDIVFADPPYAVAPEKGGLPRVREVLGEGGIFVLQQDAGEAVPGISGLTLIDRREYGRNVFLFFGMR